MAQNLLWALQMESFQIIRGFTEIKLELIKKCGLSKTPQELRLWFSFENDVLYAHDYENHKDCLALAIWEGDQIRIRVNPQGYAGLLIGYALIKQHSKRKLAEFLNVTYESHGFLLK
jgi:hypothetical protein